MADPYVKETVEILRRIAERGKAQAESLDDYHPHVDNYVHMLDEIARLEDHLQRV